MQYPLKEILRFVFDCVVLFSSIASIIWFPHREGSIIADFKVGFKRAVEQDDLPTFLSESVNKAIVDGTLDSVDAVQDSAEFNEGVFCYSKVL